MPCAKVLSAAAQYTVQDSCALHDDGEDMVSPFQHPTNITPSTQAALADTSNSLKARLGSAGPQGLRFGS